MTTRPASPDDAEFVARPTTKAIDAGAPVAARALDRLGALAGRFAVSGAWSEGFAAGWAIPWPVSPS
jgi:hypothetical protein